MLTDKHGIAVFDIRALPGYNLKWLEVAYGSSSIGQIVTASDNDFHVTLDLKSHRKTVIKRTELRRIGETLVDAADNGFTYRPAAEKAP